MPQNVGTSAMNQNSMLRIGKSPRLGGERVDEKFIAVSRMLPLQQ